MPDNLAIMKSLFSMIEAQVFLGDDPLNSGQFLTLAQPGVVLKPGLDESNLDGDDLAYQSMVLDRALDSSWLYKPKTESVSQIWWDLVEHAVLPQKTMSAEDERELRSLNDWLWDHKARYTAYQKAYRVAERAYKAADRSPDRDPELVQEARDAMNSALDDWNNEHGGAKSAYEAKQARVDYLNARDPNTQWEQLRQAKAAWRHNSHLRGDFFPSFVYPAVRDWTSPQTSWASVDLRFSSSSFQSFSRSTAWGGSVGLSFGLFSFGGGASGSHNEYQMHSDHSDLRISFEYLRAIVDRPWLSSQIFTRQNWYWDRHFYGGNTAAMDLSNGGDPANGIRPLGRMPLYTTDLLVVRNVVISGLMSEQDAQFVQNQFSAGASVGFGPFSVSGSYSESTSSTDVRGSFSGGTLTIPFAQIIGFCSSLMPRCPNPDRSLDWEPGVFEEVHALPAELATAVRSRRMLDDGNYRLNVAQAAILAGAGEKSVRGQKQTFEELARLEQESATAARIAQFKSGLLATFGRPLSTPPRAAAERAAGTKTKPDALDGGNGDRVTHDARGEGSSRPRADDTLRRAVGIDALARW